MEYAGTAQQPIPTTREVALEMKDTISKKTAIAMMNALGLIPVFCSIKASYLFSSSELRCSKLDSWLIRFYIDYAKYYEWRFVLLVVWNNLTDNWSKE